ncbi:hypothetical protein CERSUDRAFT_127175 [Gelatoporia subvermispora B]|uniref:Uncharacterized protein n=1 Tax=Ceriporiopsis subvermispora (strain B) TaxID=914234 RepID=M2Q4R3_CERS8|nr:hypothetical protein CERSUDRAFT_127175 [Gelatoporia subvermispora B]
MKSIQHRWVTFLVALSIVNIFFLHRIMKSAVQLALSRDKPLEQYTFIDEDVPTRLPLPSMRNAVALLVQDSVHYPLSAPEAQLEWWSTAVGDGNVHLGPSNRLFSVALAHQLHCLRTIRRLLDTESSPTGALQSHTVHCLNLLREHTLCAADSTLEPDDAFDGNVVSGDTTYGRRCADWLATNDALQQDYLQFSTM